MLLLSAVLAPLLLTHAAAAEYHAVRDGILMCEDPSVLPLVVLASERGEARMVDRLVAGGRCGILFAATPIYVDFLEDVVWRGMSFGEPVKGTSRVARGRMRLDNGADAYFYVAPGEITPLSSGKP